MTKMIVEKKIRKDEEGSGRRPIYGSNFVFATNDVIINE
jgi:hypothetical protein